MPPTLLADNLIEDLFSQTRSTGKHVSSAIHRVMRSLHPDRFTDDPIELVRANLGNALEHAIADALHRKYPDRYVRPGELELDGFYGTPDLLDTEEEAVVEIKLTWASSRRSEDIEDSWFWRYWVQGRSYCKMIGWTKVILIIVFIVGDWKEAKPVGFAWGWDFDQDEIDETWEFIKANAQEEVHDIHGEGPATEDGESDGDGESASIGSRSPYRASGSRLGQRRPTKDSTRGRTVSSKPPAGTVHRGHRQRSTNLNKNRRRR